MALDTQGQYLEPENYRKFKEENKRIINYLLKEFEMRKAATEYQRSFDSPTGQLDARKLATYKLNPDIFKKITEVAEGQRHGMIMLIDWSGSMFHVIDDTLRQAIILATFCRQAEIPFKVCAFTNGYPPSRLGSPDDYENLDRDSKSWNLDEFRLLEFLTHKMSNRDFTKMCEYLLDHLQSRSRRYQMYSTPLNEALIYLADYIGVFMKQNSVEKMSLITLTDGEAHPLGSGMHGRLRDYHREYVDGNYTRRKIHNFIQDPITKKNYPFTNDGPAQTETLLQLIKDRYNLKLIGFYIGSTSARDINHFLRTNCSLDYNESYTMVNAVRAEGRKNGVCMCPPGVRDKMFFIPNNKLRFKDEDLSVNPSMSVHQLAKSFGKHLKIQKTNRVLLNNFIQEIA